MQGVVGDQMFDILCGVAQGGILSPYIWNCIMGELARLLRECGGYRLTRNIEVRFLIFADDLTTLDSDFDMADRKGQIVSTFNEYVNMKLSIQKMRVIRYNSGKSKSRRDHVQVGPTEADRIYVRRDLPFECVGVKLTTKGVVSKHSAKQFRTWVPSLRLLAKLRGYTPYQLLGMFMAGPWASVGYALEVILPRRTDEYAAEFLRVVKQIFCTYNRLHNSEVQWEIGTHMNPQWWIITRAWRYRCSLWSDKKRGMLAGQIAREYLGIAGDDWKSAKFNEFMSCTGKLNPHRSAATISDSDLHKRQSSRPYHERLAANLRGELHRLGLLSDPGLNPLYHSAQEHRWPLDYLKNPQSKNSLIMHCHSLMPPSRKRLPCMFCERADSDNACHMLLDCPRVDYYIDNYRMLRNSSRLSRLTKLDQRRCLLLIDWKVRSGGDWELQNEVFDIVNKLQTGFVPVVPAVVALYE
jgi:hypothetical protein